MRKDRPLILPLKVKIKYVLNANFNLKKHYLSYKIEMLISMTIFNFFKIPKNSIIIFSTDYACKKLEKWLKLEGTAGQNVFLKIGVYFGPSFKHKFFFQN